MKRFFSLLMCILLVCIIAFANAEGTVKVKKITLSETKQLSLAPLVSWRITAQVFPENASNQEITWTSSSNKIANVDSHGVITGISPGTATITATAADGSGTKATLKVKVEKYDYVFESMETAELEYTIVPGSRYVRAKGKTGCVSVKDPQMSILLIGTESKWTVSVTPVKVGPDEVSVTGSGRDVKYKVFVSPSVFPESGAAALPDSDESSRDILFLGIPWGSSYPEAKALLEKQGKTLKKPAQRNDYIRAQIDGEVAFSTCTATNSALDFAYEPGDDDFMKKNTMFKGVHYFDPETPIEQVRLAVKSVYGLDLGTLNGDVCTWKKGNVTITMTKKEKFIILEIAINSAAGN